MKCPFCAEEIKEEAVRCKHCQADVRRGVCIACGKLNRPEAGFCRHCGSQDLHDTDLLRRKAAEKLRAEKAAAQAQWAAEEAARREALERAEAARIAEEKADAEKRRKAAAEQAAAEARARELRKQEFLRDMALIPAGRFLMGSPDGEGEAEECPRHEVYLDAYYIDNYQVTVAKYKKFCGAVGKEIPGQPVWSSDAHPVVNISWADAAGYCEWAQLRLPTEAEWEKAARGGTQTKYYFGDEAQAGGLLGIGSRDILGDYAWYYGNSDSHAHPVGQKKPNQYGLYDMQGNVCEWVADWYDEKYYKKSPTNNPQGPVSGEYRGLRGGLWNNNHYNLRSASRDWIYSDDTYCYIGFRCVVSARD